ncbi:glycosyltransferase [Fluviicola taffensis]|uniref:Glycosyl transferase family 2 n=1 Tax=Fluviicola taffensis (strain DSM 16823 / NCIMB 13979 / RW262) TaxID=755732 RepID=F2IBV1_FLUTR|nr:glycosyltransferase [Fluviicola taffensis]AEA42179.1 glycosyl transferase family 2 [Fluviicola taffensis DSM 16823]
MWLISSWVLIYMLSILTVFFGVNRLRISKNAKRMMAIDEISIVIPFRNEAHNLEKFMECVYSQRYQPAQWIFVNDHSSDAYIDLIQKMDGFPIRLLHLPEEQRGKKRAIRFGMDHVRTDFCLTMDADVTFGKDYTKSLLLLPEGELLILPVEMTGTKWWQSFFTLEYLFTTILNKGIAGWSRPVNCSGANLLIHVESFDQVDDIEDHDHVLSGDDIYTLRAFRDSGKRIEIVENEALKVETETPNTLSAVMEQRVRWLSKTGHVADRLNNFLGIWAVGLHLYYFLLLIITFSAGIYWLTLCLLLFKFGCDFMLVRMDKKKTTSFDLIGLVLFECFYPIYLFALLAYTMVTQPEWKGR